jgi:putative ABC transport system permease protein
VRIWRSSPYVALVAIVALAMGIGFTTTMFSIVHGATRPLPFDEPDEIVAVEKISTGGSVDAGIRPFDYASLASARALPGLSAYHSVDFRLAGEAVDAERVVGVAITPNAFPSLGVSALVGRTFVPADAEPTAAPPVILSHALWQRRYAADRSIVGRTVRLGGTNREVIGVMPPGFRFPVNATFWQPLGLDPAAVPRVGPRLVLFGRLAADQSIDAAHAELQTLLRNALAPHIGEDAVSAMRVRVIPFQEVETPREVIRGLYLMLVAVSFVLLIACGNVANLLLARAAVRARDTAVRLAMGATRRQLVVEQLGEVLMLSVCGAAVGVAIAHVGTRLFAVNTSHIIEAFWVDFQVDPAVWLFASVLAAVATLASGLGPSLRVARSNIADVLKDRSHGATGLALGALGRWTISLQVAVSCGVLALTIVLAQSAVAIRAVPWPFDPRQVMTFEFELAEELGDNEALRQLRIREIAAAVQNAPGVTAAALTTILPGRGSTGTFSLDAPAQDDRRRTTGVTFVSPEFFDVTRAAPRRGRLLTWQDKLESARVAVVSEGFVQRYSPSRDVVGRRVFLGSRDYTVVGVVPDLMARDVQEAAQDGVYLSILQSRAHGVRVMFTSAGDAAAALPSVRAALRRIDPEMPLTEVFTLHEAVYRDKRVLDVLSALFLVFGVGAFSLTAIGLYGVLAFGVAQRTKEIGIRLALGASRWRVVQLVIAQGARYIVVGAAAGLLLALGLSRAFGAAFEQLPRADAPLLLSLVAAVVGTAALALIVPAGRAVRTEILRALRNP